MNNLEDTDLRSVWRTVTEVVSSLEGGVGGLDHMDSLGLIIHRENLEHEQFSLSHTSHTTVQSLRATNGSAGVMRTYITPPTRSLLIGPRGCDERSRFITVLKLPQLHHSVPLISLLR